MPFWKRSRSKTCTEINIDHVKVSCFGRGKEFTDVDVPVPVPSPVTKAPMDPGHILPVMPADALERVPAEGVIHARKKSGFGKVAELAQATSKKTKKLVSFLNLSEAKDEKNCISGPPTDSLPTLRSKKSRSKRKLFFRGDTAPLFESPPSSGILSTKTSKEDQMPQLGNHGPVDGTEISSESGCDLSTKQIGADFGWDPNEQLAAMRLEDDDEVVLASLESLAPSAKKGFNETETHFFIPAMQLALENVVLQNVAAQ